MGGRKKVEGRDFADDTLATMRFRSQGLEALLDDLLGERWKDNDVALAGLIDDLDVAASEKLVRAVIERAAQTLTSARSMDRWLASGGVRPTDW